MGSCSGKIMYLHGAVNHPPISLRGQRIFAAVLNIFLKQKEIEYLLFWILQASCLLGVI